MTTWYDAGRVAPVPKGKWSSTTAYYRLDAVTDSTNSRLFIAKVDVPAGTSLTNTTYWVEILNNTEAIESANSAVSTANNAKSKIDQLFVDTVERLTSPYNETGSILAVYPVENYPIDAISHIEPVQVGSGEPYPAGGGKNLLHNTATTQTVNGVMFTVNADGSVTANGTAEGNAVFRIPCRLVAGKIYTLSGCPAGGSTSTYYMQLGYFGNDTGNGVTATATENTGSSIALLVLSGVKVTNLNFYPMIEEGNTKTDWQPYSNIRPISGHGGCELTRCGKNLADSSPKQSTTASGITFAVSNDGLGTKVTGTSTAAWAQNSPNMYPTITVQPGTYTFTRSRVNSISDGTVGFMLRINGVNGDFVTSQAKTLTFSEQTKIGWFALVLETGVTVDCTVWLQIEFGSTATAYEPYQGETFSADFGQTVYGGTLDWNTGVLTVDRAYIEVNGDNTSGVSEWAAHTFALNCSAVQYAPAYGYKADEYCDRYRVAKNYSDLVSNNNTFTTTNSWQIIVHDNRAGNADELVAIIASEPFQVAYKLASPTTIQLTPQEILAIKGTNTVWSTTGDTTAIGRLDPDWFNNNLLKRVEALEAAIVSNV